MSVSLTFMHKISLPFLNLPYFPRAVKSKPSLDRHGSVAEAGFMKIMLLEGYSTRTFTRFSKPILG